MNEIHDIKKETGKYYLIYGTLLVFTVITVGLNYLHLPIVFAILIALVVAGIKASLVACFFMHLISEQKLIYLILGFTVFFFVCMMGLFFAGYYDLPQGSFYVS